MTTEPTPPPIEVPTIIELTTCTVDLGQHVVISGDERIKLGSREVQLLQYLGARPSQVVPREEIFTEVWGYDPNTMSRAVDHTVKRLRAKIEADTSNPKHLFSLYGQGYKFEPISTISGVTQGVLSTNVGPQDTPLFGRDADIDALEQRLAGGPRMVTLLGTGGIGKTRLSQEIARRAATESTFAGGTWFCDLVECRSFRDILHTVSDALCIRLESTDDPIASSQALGRAIGTRGEMFIVLDNFEQVAEFAHQTVAAWHNLADSAQFLITSRQPLALPAEQVYTLQPLSAQAGFDLFVDRAKAVRPGWSISPEDQETITQIVAQLDSIPLAILLAAGRASSMSPEQILVRLEKRFRLLRRGTRISENRQDTMQVAIDWSWDLLDDVERSALQQSAVFRSGFTLEAAEAVIDLSPAGDYAPSVKDVLQALADKSMLHVQAAPEKALDYRICAFDNIRYYALEKFDAEGTLSAARKRHADYFKPWAKRQVEGLDHALAFRSLHRLRYEVDNLVAAFEVTLAHAPANIMSLAIAIERVYFSNGWYQGNVEMLEALVPVCGEMPLEDQFPLYHLLGRNLQAQGLHEAEQEAKLCLKELLADHPEHKGNLSVLFSDINQLSRELRHAEARDRLQACIDERPNLPAQDLCSVHAKLGLILYGLQDMESAASHLQRAIDLGKGTVDQSWLASLMGNLGAIYIALGEIARGQKHLQQALEEHERFGNRTSVAIALANLAQADLRLAAPQSAAVRLQRAVALLRDFNRVSVLVETMLILAIAHAIAGERKAAADMLTQARQAARNDPLYLALTTAVEAALTAEDGNNERAKTLWAEASPVITLSAIHTPEQWQELGDAHIDLTKAAKLIKNPLFCIPRHPNERPGDVPSGLEHHQLHILLLEHRVAHS